MNGRKAKDLKTSAKHTWSMTFSEEHGLTINLSKDIIASWGKATRSYLVRHALKWVIAGLTTVGGLVGGRALLLQQQDTPATPPVEDVAPKS